MTTFVEVVKWKEVLTISINLQTNAHTYHTISNPAWKNLSFILLWFGDVIKKTLLFNVS